MLTVRRVLPGYIVVARVPCLLPGVGGHMPVLLPGYGMLQAAVLTTGGEPIGELRDGLLHAPEPPSLRGRGEDGEG